MKNANRGLLAIAWLAGSMAALTSLDARAQATTSNVAVSGSTVTATVTPLLNATVFAAEFFVDSTGVNGSGTPMTLSGDPLVVVTATGTLPYLPVGSSHTLYVHGEDGSAWGAFASTTFNVTSATVALPIGSAAISYFNFGTKYLINFWPTDPCTPVDPCRVRSRFGTWSAAETLGYARTTVNVADGVMSLFTRETIATEPCAPTDPCRRRDVLIGFVATNGLKYSATTVGLDTTYLAK